MAKPIPVASRTTESSSKTATKARSNKLVSGVSAPKQDRSQATHDRLIAATHDLLLNRTLDDIAIIDITTAAGVSTGVFYQRFENKTAVMIAVQDRYVTDARSALHAISASVTTASPEEVVEQIITGVLEWVRLHRRLLRSFLWFLVTDPEHSGRLATLTRDITETLEENVLRAGGTIPDAREFRFRMQCVVGLIVHSVLNAPGPLGLDDADLPDRLVQLVATTITGGS
jgi:AcrR family transcriptional regulator